LYCPSCKAEFRDGVLGCADCGVELVEELLDSPGEEDEEEEVEFERLLEIGDEDDFALLAAGLDEAGIAWLVDSEEARAAQPSAAPRGRVAVLYVDRKRAHEAQAICAGVEVSGA
jgi:hypothetical protein